MDSDRLHKQWAVISPDVFVSFPSASQHQQASPIHFEMSDKSGNNNDIDKLKTGRWLTTSHVIAILRPLPPHSKHW
jgi:hypothetical protein